MLGNIIDHRTDSACPEIDAVFEPSFHDHAKRTDGTLYFDPEEPYRHLNGFHVTHSYDTTVCEAVLSAETEWTFPVTIYLYDKGTVPLG